MTLNVKMTMPDLQRYPWNLLLIKNGSFFIAAYITNKKCKSLYRRETANEAWQFKATQILISNSYLIGLKGYCCKSGIAIFARRITRKYTYSLINKIFSSTRKQCVVQQGEPNLRCANFSGESNNLINWQIHFAT